MRTVSSLLVIIVAPGWLANSAHIMKPFRKCGVQFVSDAFAFVSDCQCVLLPQISWDVLVDVGHEELKEIGIHVTQNPQGS